MSFLSGLDRLDIFGDAFPLDPPPLLGNRRSTIHPAENSGSFIECDVCFVGAPPPHAAL